MLVEFEATTHYFGELANGWLLVGEHQLDSFEVVHHIKLVHEHLKRMHRLFVILIKNMVRFFRLQLCVIILNFIQIRYVILKFYFTVDLVVLVLPPAITKELVVDRSPSPVSLLQ